ncbi:MAG: S41 family peptidase [Alphaproteobacteria bacterium]|nr:S41 family peptidase [Alphaproteobacteria bacterium]
MQKAIKTKILMPGLIVTALLTPHITYAKDADLSGIWQSIGYGIWFSVAQDGAKIYQTTKDTCVDFLTMDSFDYQGNIATIKGAKLAGLGQYMPAQDFKIELKDGLLNLEIGKVNPVQAKRMSKLPATCNTLTTNTAGNNFEVFWQFFNENYPFFELRNVDWQESYATFRPKINAATSDEDLFKIIQDMIAPLGDGHVSIISPMGEFIAVNKPEWADGLEEEDMPPLAMMAAENYLKNGYKTTANGTFIYGKLTLKIGYINLLGFDDLMGDDGDTNLLKNSMDEILSELKDVESIVIDIRINFGGDDTSGLFVAGYFTDQKQVILRKSVWVEGAFKPIADIELAPTSNTPFTGNIYLLTSRLSISAAETFALALAQLPHVTLVGEPSNGMLSDQWFLTLPNGWIGTISNERYLSADGELFEAKGVPVDIQVPVKIGDYNAKYDAALEYILKLSKK